MMIISILLYAAIFDNLDILSVHDDHLKSAVRCHLWTRDYNHSQHDSGTDSKRYQNEYIIRLRKYIIHLI